MLASQLQFDRLVQIPEEYRREAAAHRQIELAKGLRDRSARGRFASLLRRMADAIEPTPFQPPVHL